MSAAPLNFSPYIMVELNYDPDFGGVFMTPYNYDHREKYGIGYVRPKEVDEFVDEQIHCEKAQCYLKVDGYVRSVTISSEYFFERLGTPYQKPSLLNNSDDEIGFLEKFGIL